MPFQATTTTITAVFVANQITEARYSKTTSQASCMDLPKRFSTLRNKGLTSFASTPLMKPSLTLHLNSAYSEGYPSLATHKVQDTFLGDHSTYARSKCLACPADIGSKVKVNHRLHYELASLFPVCEVVASGRILRKGWVLTASITTCIVT